MQSKAGHDVHTFVQQLCSYHPMLLVDKLGDKPSSDRDSAKWKKSMRICSMNTSDVTNLRVCMLVGGTNNTP